MLRKFFPHYAFLLLLPLLNAYGQSTVTIGRGSTVSINAGSNLTAGYRDGTMQGTGTYQSQSILYDPAASAATSIIQTGFNANWNLAGGSAPASGYKIDVSTSSTFASFITGYQNLDVGNVITYAVSSLSAGTQYYYRIRAYDANGITGYSSTISVLTVPATPTASAGTAVNESGFTANWSSSATATKYFLDVATDAGFTNLVDGWDNKDVGNVTTYSVSVNLNAATTYYYRVRAANSSGTSPSSNTITVLTAPLPPVAIAAASITQTSFSAKWNASAGATAYFLDVSTDSLFGAGHFVTGYQNLNVANVTSYSVNTNLISGTVYYYRIRSNNGDGTSTNSNRISVITVPGETTAKTAASISQTSFTAIWNAVKGATKYYVDVAADNGFTAFVTDWENADAGSDTTISVNTNLSEGTDYYYRVRANNSSGTSGNSNTVNLITIPPAPVTIAATSPSQTSFDANWNLADGAEGYKLDVSSTNTFSSFVTGWTNVDVANVTTYSVNTGLSPGVSYYYRLRAYNANGTSGNSNITSITIVPPDPAVSAATNVSTTSFSANWNASAGAAKYYIDLAADNGFTAFVTGWENVDAGASTSISVNTNLAAATTYYYRIRANNSSGTSGNSGTITVLTAPLATTANAASDAAETSFTANWDNVAGADGYYLDVSANTDFNSGTFVTGYENRDVGAVNSYSVSQNLTAGTMYYYRIRSYNSGGTSGNSNKITFITLPAAPVPSSAASITGASFTAKWNASVSATGYILDVSDVSDFSSRLVNYNGRDVNNVTSFAVSGLTANTTYYYRVSAFNDYGTGNNSASITVLTAPDKPTVQAASAIQNNGFSANWLATAGATGYYLDVSTSNTFASYVSGFNSLDVGNVTSFIVTGLSAGTSYYYRVRAYSGVSPGADSDTEIVLTLPAAPVASAASAVAAAGFTANWSPSVSATGYRLDVSEDPAFGSNLAAYDNLDVGDVSSKAVAGLTSGNTYYYRIKAYNASGTDGNSNIVSVSTIPPAPSEQAATSIASNGFTANWLAANGATGYRLDVSSAADYSSFLTGYNNRDVGNVLSYSVTGLSAGTSYYYRIRAYNTGGTSASSGDANPVTSGLPPRAPAVNPASSVTSTSFDANWIASAGATKYYLDVSTFTDFRTYVTDWQDLDAGNVVAKTVNTNLTAGTQYYYRVRAFNADGLSSNSSVISVVTSPAAPNEQPQTNVTNYSFEANWDAVAGASGYRLDVSTVADFASRVTGYDNLDVGNVIIYTVTGLAGGTTYYYRAKAYNTGGTSDPSGSITFATLADPAGTVTATSATAIGETSFTANWNAYGGAAGYKIDVATDPGFGALTLVSGYADLDVANVTSYVVNSNLSGGTVYYYRIKAYDGSSAPIAASGNITVVTIPPPPVESAASLMGETGFTANWNASAGATGYYIDVATDLNMTSFVTGFNNKYVNNVTSYSVTGLVAGTQYYYQIRAKNSSGSSGNSGKTVTITSPKEPEALAASAIQSASFDANWSSSTGASKYYIDVSTDPAFGSFVAGWDTTDVGSNTTYSINSGINAGTTYYYRVRANNGSGTSGNSLSISLTTAPAAPIANNPSSISSTNFTANWSASTGASKYFIDVSTNSSFNAGTFVAGFENLDAGNSTSVLVNGLSPGTTYYYQVRAFNSNGTSDNSNSKSALTIPAAPSVNPVSIKGDTYFTASWGSVQGASGYRLDVSTVSNFTSYVNHWQDVDAGNVLNKSVNTDLSAGNTYYFRVRAYNASGTGINSETMRTETTPPAPVATAATTLAVTGLNANWNPSAGAAGYYLSVSDVSDFSTTLGGFDDLDVGNVTAYAVSGLSGGTEYYYKVSAYVGSSSSPASNTITALTVPPTVTSTAATGMTSTSIEANWNPAAGASGYYLDVAENNSFASFVAGFNNKDVSNVTTFTATGLSPNTNYYYRVRAYNASGTAANSNTVIALTVTAAPVAAAASSISNVAFTANWAASAGATKYYLDVATTNTFDAGTFVGLFNNKDIGNVTSYSVGSLNGNTNYYYRVRAYNSSGQSGNSGIITVTTAVDPSPAPVASAASTISTSGFSANWNAAATATGYRLDVATDAGFTSFITGFEDLDVHNVITYSVSGLTAGTVYHYRVRSYNISGTSSNSGTINTITLPSAPATSAATSLAETSFNANWNSVTGATSYYLDVSTDGSFATFVAGYQDKDAGNVATYSVTGLSGGTNYYYRVRAYNTSGQGSSSGSQSALTIPPASVASAASSITQTGFTANWASSTGASKYFLDVSTDAAFGAGNFVAGFENKDVSNVTSYVVIGLNKGINYYYRTRAFNSTGTSANSNTINQITIPEIPLVQAATAHSETGFTANWLSVTGASNYYLDIATDDTFSPGMLVTDYDNKDVGNTTSKSVAGLSGNTVYYYRVRSGNAGGTSGNSGTDTTATTTPAPVANASTNSGESYFTANWNAVAGAVSYKLDISTTSTFDPGTLETDYDNKDVGNVTAFAATNLTSSTTHFYRLRAFNSYSSSANSNTIKVLGVPFALQATSVTQVSFVANWNSVPGVIGYRIDIATDISFDPATMLAGMNDKDLGNVTSYTVTGLSANTTYYYRVRAYDGDGPGGNSNITTVKNLPDPPVAKAASEITADSFKANWNASAGGATGYYLDVAKDAAFTDFVQGYQNLVVYNVLSYNVTGLGAGRTYYYRVRAYSSLGSSDNSNTINLICVPGNPEIGIPSEITQISFLANWSSGSNGVEGYLIDVASDKAFTDYLEGFRDKEVGNETSFKVTGNLNPGNVYYYRVRAYNTNGTSGNSGTQSVLMIPATPVFQRHENILASAFTVKWDTVAGAGNYYIDVARDGNFSDLLEGFNNKNVGNDSVYAVPGLSSNKKYFIRLRSGNNSGTSPYSAVDSVLTLPLVPVAAAASERTQSGFTANWQFPSGGAEWYEVDAAKDSLFNSYLDSFRSRNAGNNNSLRVDTGIVAGTNYYYRVRAVNASGRSDNSLVINTVTVTLAPSGLKIVDVTKNRADISWLPSSGAIGYYLDVSVNKDFSVLLNGYNHLDIGDSLSFRLSSLNCNSKYYCRLRAYNRGGESEYSDVLEIQTLPNQVPVISGLETVPLVYKIKGDSTTVTNTLQISDADDAVLKAAFVWFRSNYVKGEDKILHGAASGLTFQWDEISGILIIRGEATVQEYQSAISEIRYVNLSPVPTKDTRIISFYVSDGIGNSESKSRYIDFETRNTAPVLSGLNADTLLYKKGSEALPLFGGVSVGDADDLYSYSAKIKFENGYIAGEDALQFSASPNISTEYDENTGVLTFIGKASKSEYSEILRSVKYFNKLGFDASYSSKNASAEVSDAQSESNTVNVNINIVSPVSAPSNLTAACKEDGDVCLTWKDNSSNESGFIIQIEETTGINGGVMSVSYDTVSANWTEFTDEHTKECCWYSYKVFAYLENGGRSDLGDGNRTSLQTSLRNPAELRAQSDSAGVVILSWRDNSEAETGYIIEKSEGDSLQFEKIAEVGKNICEYRDSVIVNGVRYFYSVIAVMDTVYSKRSNTASVIAVVTDISRSDLAIPSKYELYQNYPNPFNPVTTIKFGLPVESKVTLKIFNMLAEEISVVADRYLSAGNYVMNFNASSLASGVYIYRIEATSIDGRRFTQTRKMLLLK